MTTRTLLRSVLVLAVASTAALSRAEDRVPIRLALPKPVLVGTPVPIKLANLEPKPAETPNILVPPGTVNLALGKTVTASDEAPLLGDTSLITDDDKSADEGCYVEFGPGKQWIQVDLEKSSPIYAVAVWHFHSQARAYLDVVIQISDDRDFITGVTTVYNSDHDNSSGLGAGKDPAYIETYKGRLIPTTPEGVKGRYVRFYSNGNNTNNLNHYIEVEVYGQPAT